MISLIGRIEKTEIPDFNCDSLSLHSQWAKYVKPKHSILYGSFDHLNRPQLLIFVNEIITIRTQEMLGKNKRHK